VNARQEKLFQHTFAATGCLAAAARAAELPLAEARRLRDCAPPPGADAGADADLDRALAALESEAVRRALSGVEIPVFHQGRECGSTVKHSDQLLMFLLKTLKPERYAGGREGAQQARPVVLDVDLSAAEAAGEEAAGEEAEGEGEER
jgi:hypothetical protein